MRFSCVISFVLLIESKSTPIYTEPESTILTLQPPAPLIVKPPPPVVEKGYKQPPKKIKKILANSTMYSVADLQVATNSFNADENLIGEGSLGRVYRAEFSNGKVFYIFMTIPYYTGSITEI